jgi:predicted transcriptional regulator
MMQVVEYTELGEIQQKKFVFDDWDEYQHLGEFRFINSFSGETLTLFKRNISSLLTRPLKTNDN